jgi:hypothetical protein
MYAGIAFTVVFSIPALVREIRLARRYDRPPAVRGPGHQRRLQMELSTRQVEMQYRTTHVPGGGH